MTENVTVVNGESTVVVDMSFDGTAFNYVVTEDGTEIMNANGTITAQDNDFGMDMTATADGETVNMNIVVKNTVAMFYAAQEPVEEETAVTVAE